MRNAMDGDEGVSSRFFLQCIKIECPCSGKYTRHNKSKHIKTKKHIKNIEQNNNQEI